MKTWQNGSPGIAAIYHQVQGDMNVVLRLNNFLHASHRAALQADFDAMRMIR